MRIERRHAPTPPIGALVGAIAVVGGGLLALWLRWGLPLPDCAFRAATGVPCPTCGTVRLVRALGHGDVAGAAASNPLVFAGLLSIVLWAVTSATRWALRLPAWWPVLARAERWGFAVLAVAAVGMGWGYVIWRGG